MDKTLQTIGTVLLVAVLFIGIAVLAQEFMNVPIIQEIHERVTGMFNFMVPNYTITIDAINGELISGTKTVHYYVSNATGGTVDIAEITVTTDKAVRVVLEVVTDISGAEITATITKDNAIVVKDVEQTETGRYLLKLAIYPAFESEGATVPENVTEYTTEVTIKISATIPAQATGYVSVRVAEATYI